jgi:hypothetical protein
MVIEMVTATTQREDSVKMIEQALALMEAERAKLLDQQTQHDEQERRLAFDARLGSAEASKLLDQLRREKSKMQSQIDSIDAAMAEGQRRLVVARAHEQQKQNAIQAAALRKVLTKFSAAGRELDEAMAKVVSSSHELRSALHELHGHGIDRPRPEMIDALGFRALATGLRQTIWAPHFEAIGFHDRKNFGDLIASWSSSIDRAITAQFGGQADEAV